MRVVRWVYFNYKWLEIANIYFKNELIKKTI
jgi:hypothetical protein